jgi:hypothetical protein
MPKFADDDLIEDVLDKDSELTRWLAREAHVYFAHNGRDGTAEGLREHFHKAAAACRSIRRLVFEEMLDAFVEADPTCFDR